ncbi:hypothetical protein P4O66_000876 [Electrophorus voltai]|uniref:Uncharacterized protein n=1 Tax=Electrophorus voltai TaxID=2609070 RepID=A0AAD8ZEX9_9TELE|nr:hypothetical protein P4O66_000876 [Electrophorus voltai]
MNVSTKHRRRDLNYVEWICPAEEYQHSLLTKKEQRNSGSVKLQLNIIKKKKMVVDFMKLCPPLSSVTINGVDVEVVGTYKYLVLHSDDKLDRSSNTYVVFKKGQSRLYFLRLT